MTQQTTVPGRLSRRRERDALASSSRTSADIDAIMDDLARIETACRGWHTWVSDAGRFWATATESAGAGSGTTVDADTLKELRKAITAAESAWSRNGAAGPAHPYM